MFILGMILLSSLRLCHELDGSVFLFSIFVNRPVAFPARLGAATPPPPSPVPLERAHDHSGGIQKSNTTISCTYTYI